MTACVMAAMVLAAGLPFPAEASENYELRKRVIRLTGIMSTTGDNIEVTRGEYTQMLVNASPYRSSALKTSSTAVFSDVAVCIGSENCFRKWMA